MTGPVERENTPQRAPPSTSNRYPDDGLPLPLIIRSDTVTTSCPDFPS